ncbi:unnamed protein product [Linum trigynum]|uniref:Secreted protein n=1 Tax=Linum trigynum TaxID=586398 RepID=A0AAV2CJ79_9ROSI
MLTMSSLPATIWVLSLKSSLSLISVLASRIWVLFAISWALKLPGLRAALCSVSASIPWISLKNLGSRQLDPFHFPSGRIITSLGPPLLLWLRGLRFVDCLAVFSISLSPVRTSRMG